MLGDNHRALVFTGLLERLELAAQQRGRPFTPTSCSWANAVEGSFAKLTRQRLKRGVFTSIAELQAAINRNGCDAEILTS